jgi:hypothetical protein
MKATVYRRQRSNQASVYFHSDIFEPKEEVIVSYFEDGIQIKRASISAHQKNTLKLVPRGDKSYTLTLKKSYEMGTYEIEVIDRDTIFVPCLMLE